MGNKLQAGFKNEINEEAPLELIQYPNGDIFEGRLSKNPLNRGIRDGFGRYASKDRQNPFNYEYEGEWLNNRRNGQGRCYYYDGDLYQG